MTNRHFTCNPKLRSRRVLTDCTGAPYFPFLWETVGNEPSRAVPRLVYPADGPVCRRVKTRLNIQKERDNTALKRGSSTMFAGYSNSETALAVLAARRQQSSGSPYINFGNQQSFDAIGLIGQQCPVRAYHRRCRGRTLAREVNGREITRVFGGAAERSFLVEGVCGIGEGGRRVVSGFGFVKVRMKDDVGTACRCPAHRFRITPSLVANHNPELHGTILEHMSF